MSRSDSSRGIAVVGISCWYPGAESPRKLWENVLARRRQFRTIPDERLPLSEYCDPDPSTPDKTYGRLAALIDGFDFQWARRRIPFSTFQAADIVHWLALEVALSAIDDAGYERESLDGAETGVIIGNSLTGEQTRSNAMRPRWPFVRKTLLAAAKVTGHPEGSLEALETTMESLYKSVFPPFTSDSLAGGLANTIAGRICNYLDLGGGGYTVDGACSSSLLAVTTAANSLHHGDLNLALAGGVDISLDTFELVGFSKTGALTPDDMTVYDRRGKGFIPGEGCGFVVLKRLEDACRDGDFVYAVLRGWGVSSDGGGVGLTAPSAQGQARALRQAYSKAGYSPASLDFVEGHGTGTKAGDKAELEGIQLALSDFQPARRSVGVTSLKSVIGHTKAAAGIGGFIKAVMAVNRRILPPIANCVEPHPIFDDQAQSLFPILTGEVRSSSEKIRAGVSAMGFGGINCHVTLESADPPSSRLEPSVEERALMVSSQVTEVFVLAAESWQELTRRLEDLQEAAEGIAFCELTDLAALLAGEVDPRAPIRCATVADRPESLVQRIEYLLEAVKNDSPEEGRLLSDQPRAVWLGKEVAQARLGMLFPGQGSQRLNMARVLVERFEWARSMVDQADRWAEACGGEPFSGLIYRNLERAEDAQEQARWAETLSRTEHAQPAICLASVLWLRYLERLGVVPCAVGGHSLGELTAFYAAGAFDLEALIRLATVRGLGMATPAETAGTMATCRCSREAAEALVEKVPGYVVVANINAPRQVVISGERGAIEDAIRLADESGIQARRLKGVSNAFHSRLAAGAAEVLARGAILPGTLGPLSARLFSSTNGQEAHPGVDLRRHFSEQVLAKVDFVATVASLAAECDVLIEVGPGRILSGLSQDILGTEGPSCLPIESRPSQDRDLNTMLATAFVHGVDVRWEVLYENRLVRPFKPAADRLFIENPCEREFKPDEAAVARGTALRSSQLGALITDALQLPEESFRQYFAIRGGFLADVVKADMRALGQLQGEQFAAMSSASLEPGASGELGTEVPGTGLKAAGDESGAAADAPGNDGLTRDSIQEILAEEVIAATQFPRETFTMDARLLDDLMLDSLKSAALVAAVSKRVGLEGRINATAFANSRLEDLVERVVVELEVSQETTGASGTSSGQAGPGEGGDDEVLELVRRRASEITGYPLESLESDALVGQELGLTKELLQSLIHDCARTLGVPVNLDLEPLLGRSLEQIASILERLKQSGAGDRVMGVVTLPDWVREFEVALVKEPLPPLPRWWGQRQEDDWRESRVLVFSAQETLELADVLHNGLLRVGAQVHSASFDDPGADELASDPEFSHLVALLPPNHTAEPVFVEAIRAQIARMASVASPPHASEAPRRRTTVVFVQFAGGCFGYLPHYAHLARGASRAFAASLHLERPDLRVRCLDFSPTLDPDQVVTTFLNEVNTPSSFVAAGIDASLERNAVRPRLLQPLQYRPRPHAWSEDDVVLVTGGARGITASCALGVARATRARMVLIGRSKESDSSDGSANPEIEKRLQEYKDRGLLATYLSCDVTDPEAVETMVARVRTELGPITGVIHGAGLNIPRPVGTVSVDDAMLEIGPKVAGAINLLRTLADAPPRLVVGLTSVLGVTGMEGNTWYAYSNEALDRLLRDFRAAHEQTETLSVAFGLWKTEGMAVRLGSVEELEARGIEGLTTEQGVKRFVRLWTHTPTCHQVVVTASFSSIDTWNPEPGAAPARARFLEHLVRHTPGIESVFHVHLSLARDPYLRDHQFQGSCLFPAVFGLEAMAQAAAHAVGRTHLGNAPIEEIEFKRAIEVDPNGGADIEIHAIADEQASELGETLVRTAVYRLDTDLRTPFFSAVFRLGAEEEAPTVRLDLPKEPLPIRPAQDLYQPDLLFQGPKFQRLEQIWSLEEPEERARACVSACSRLAIDAYGEAAFSNPEDRAFLLGDPFFRDTLLQTMLLLVPKETCLPVRIARVKRFGAVPGGATRDLEATAAVEGRTLAEPQTASGEKGNAVVVTRLEDADNSTIVGRVVAATEDGQVLEQIEGLCLGVVAHRDELPAARDLLLPDERDGSRVCSRWSENCRQLEAVGPVVGISYLPGIHDLDRAQRHELELPLMRKTLDLACERFSLDRGALDIEWRDDGKPLVVGTEAGAVDISLAHDDRLCVCVCGARPQGCDVAPVTTGGRAEWVDLLGRHHETLLNALLDLGDSLDVAGSRIWAVMETRRKARGRDDGPLAVERTAEDRVMFRSGTGAQTLLVLTAPLSLTWGPPRILATVVEATSKGDSEHDDALSWLDSSGYDALQSPYAELLRGAGPQGQPVMVQRFTVTFRPSAQLSRKVYFSNYLFWAGEIRENSAWPILGEMTRHFTTGKAGGVTNWAHVWFYGEATTHDVIEARMWTSDNGGPRNSTMELSFDLRRSLPQGGYERLAWMKQQTTWVKVLDHGRVEPDEYPEYYRAFAEEMLPRNDAPNTPEILPEPLEMFHPGPDTPVLFQAPVGPRAVRVLHETILETSLDTANIVGNIYFANYFTWQGHARDRFFFSVVPEFFRGTGRRGEPVCLESEVHFLREAMPFDRIVVTTGLKILYPTAARFRFEYFRAEPTGKRVALAWGEQVVAWVHRDEEGNPRPAEFPEAVLQAFARAMRSRPM